jgi:peptidoglycan/xylan/chitin deacetylase (PgdA/CDA1 family)
VTTPPRAAILTYHSLDDSGSAISVTPGHFRAQMEALAGSGLQVVPLTELAHYPSAVAITFDDGFANFVEYAAPVLEGLGLPATVFVVSGYCGKRNNWPTQPSGFPELPLMSWSTLRDLPPGISLGAHTVTHPDLRELGGQQVADEIRNSRVDIEQNTGRAVATFAYPYGAVDDRAAAVVRREFSIGCGTRLDFVQAGSDSAVLPRLDAYYLRSPQWTAELFTFPVRMYVGFRRCLRTARATAYFASKAMPAASRPSQ